jgi:hypothetical protein
MKKTAVRIFTVLLFSIGVLTGAALLFAATWADVESVFYGFDRFGNKATSAMHCPVIMAEDESGEIVVRYKNKTDQPIRPSLRLQISSRSLFREESARMSLNPGESETLRWEVTRGDLAIERFIFVKLFSFASYPQRDIEQTCGILVLDLHGFTGSQVLVGTISISLVGMLSGCALWSLVNRPMRDRALDASRAMVTLTVTVSLGIATVLLASWPLGIMLSALSLLLTGVILGFFIQSAKP